MERLKFRGGFKMSEEIKISELKVMISASGYFLGREAMENGITIPYVRYSEYYSNVGDAEKTLVEINQNEFHKKGN